VLIALKTLLHTLLLPPASLLALGLVGVALIRHRKRFGLLLVSLSLLSLWLLATPKIGLAIYRLADKYPELSADAPVAAGAIVILGGDAGWTRLVYGAALARRTGLPVLVTSTAYEAPKMQETLQAACGIRAQWVDSGARDTFDNAQRTALILRKVPISRIALVTDSSHMARAVDEFEAAGFTVLPAPVVVDPQTDTGVYVWIPTVQGLHYANLGLYELIGRPVSAVLRRWRTQAPH